MKVYAAEYNAGIVELQGSNGEKEFCFFTAKASTEIQLQILFADTGMLFVAFYNTCLLLADHSFYMLNKTHSESKIWFLFSFSNLDRNDINGILH